MVARPLAYAFSAAALIFGCHKSSGSAGCVADDSAPATLHAQVQVVDESGAPVAGAKIDLGDASYTTDGAGKASFDSPNGPAFAIVSAPGSLSEPLPIGWSQPARVTLLSDHGGKRLAIHSAGDVMLGRRYEAPPAPATPLIPRSDPATGARNVVSLVKRAFAMADVRTLNLETVVSDKDDGAAYPGKRFILRSRPGALAGVSALSPSVACTANNHSRDFGDDGIGDTLGSLHDANIPVIGATPDGAAEAPFTQEVRGTNVGVLAWTTVDGSFVNDSYPKDGDPEPPNVADKDKFQYDSRSWGYTGAKLAIPTASRRIGSAWDAFSQAETGAVPPDDDAAGWASLAKIYPEMQDWVARRGHGGAEPWDQKGSIQAIKDLKAKSDIVVVQLHAGFQFQEAASANVRAIAHAAIDAGADLVVCHHPHVVQGLEWYKGKLVAYSLGNFVFDQDFLSTFSSAILRTVWEGSEMVEARLVPVEIVDYQPAIVTSGAAASTFTRIWERSVLRASTDRAPDGSVVAYLDEPGADAKLAHFVLEHDTARIVDAPPPVATVDVNVPAHGTAAIPFSGLIQGTLGVTANDPVYVGRDTFNWGRFEDEVADGAAKGDAHWDVAGGQCDKGVMFGDGRGFLSVRRSSVSSQDVLARPVARIPLFRYHLRGPIADGAKPVDPDPSYSVRMSARVQGSATPSIRLDLYHFDDTDPTEDPTSDLVKTIDLPMSLDGGWKTVDLPIPTDALGPTSAANMVFVYVKLTPPCEAACKLDVDDLALVEWRKAGLMTDRFGAFGFVKNDGDADVTVHAAGWPLAR